MSPARKLLPALALVLATRVAPLAAEPAAQPAKGCPSDTSALATLARGVAEQLGAVARGAEVRVATLEADRDLPSRAALEERVRAAIVRTLSDSAATGGRAPQKLLVELAIEKRGGVLRVTADLRRAHGLWQRLRRGRKAALAHAFVEAPLDAELRALIPPPPLVATQVLKLKSPERSVLALACGRLGQEGGQELALVTRSAVHVGRIVGGSFVERRRAAWSALSKVAPAPLREPIASAEITSAGELRVGSSDRSDGLVLSRDLQVSARFPGLLPVPGGGCLAREGLGFRGKLERCQPSEDEPRPRPIRGTLDAIASDSQTLLGREVGRTTLSGMFMELSPYSSHFGAQLALGDADSDGLPELAFASDTLDPETDRLTLVTLEASKLVPRFQLPAPAISAIALCSLREDAGMAPLVVATGDELWLIR